MIHRVTDNERTSAFVDQQNVAQTAYIKNKNILYFHNAASH